MKEVFLLLPLTLAAQLSPSVMIGKIVIDPAGQVYVSQGSRISKVDQWSTTIPFPVGGMSLTASGNIVAAGPGSMVTLDPATGNIVSTATFLIPTGAFPESVTVTPAGNIILSGPNGNPAATPGALNIPGQQAFLMKLDPSGKLLWTATGIGGAVTADASENIYVAGSAELANFPTTPNAFQRAAAFNVCGSSGGLISFLYPCPQQYVAKVSPDGSTLLFSTYLTGNLGAYPSDIALGPDGSIYTAGSVSATDYPVSAGALFSTNPAKFLNTLCSCIVPEIGYSSSGFVSRLSADGSQLLYSTYLGGSQRDSVSAVAVAKDGSLVVAGLASSPDFPGLPQQLDDCRPGSSLWGEKSRVFCGRISPDGSRIGAQLIGGTNPGAGIACITDAANSQFADVVSPGQLITINGFSVGPMPSVVADLENPQTPLGGVSVTFDGVPAQLTAAGGTLVTAIVPFAIAGKQQTRLTVLHNGIAFDSRQLNVRSAYASLFLLPPDGKTCHAAPPVNFGVFTGASPTPSPLIFNSDGTINACDNPASSASVVTLFLNGLGIGTPQVTVDLGIAVTTAEIGTQAAVAAVRIQLPAIDPAPGNRNALYLHVMSAGQPLYDYGVNRGIPLYVK